MSSFRFLSRLVALSSKARKIIAAEKKRPPRPRKGKAPVPVAVSVVVR